MHRKQILLTDIKCSENNVTNVKSRKLENNRNKLIYNWFCMVEFKIGNAVWCWAKMPLRNSKGYDSTFCKKSLKRLTVINGCPCLKNMCYTFSLSSNRYLNS